MNKRARHAAILDLIGSSRVSSQDQLRRLLAERGFDVTQATLSRDIRELRLAKATDATGTPRYIAGADGEPAPSLARLLSALLVDLDGTGNLLLIRTLAGGAQPVAVALDSEDWPEVLGTIAGDDTILVVLRHVDQLQPVQRRLRQIAGDAGPEQP